MLPPNFPNRIAGNGAFSREDICPSDTDSTILPTPDEVPGSIWQAVGQESMPTSIPPTPDYPREEISGTNRRPERPFLGAPLSLRTMNGTVSMPEGLYRDRSGTDSPSNQISFMPTPPFATLRHTASEDHTSSPRTERLPSFRQLSKIADGGTETESRTTAYPALPAHTATMVSQSPAKALPYFTGNQQSSPTATFAMLNHTSPTGARPESHEAFPIPPSPSQYPMPDQNRYAQRRRSLTSSRQPPSFGPSLTSSSNETNVSYQSSGAESYATSSTTPTEMGVMDGASHGPMSHSTGTQQSPSIAGVFICEFPGCNAPAFQTQYLLK